MPRFIGGEFCAKDNEDFLVSRFDGFDTIFPTCINKKPRHFFETGSDSLAQILNEITVSEGALWVPENFCMESLKRARNKVAEKTLPIRFWRDAEQLFADLSQGDSVLFVHFNGYDDKSRDKILSVTTEKGAILIEDYVQSPLEIAQSKGDYAFNSLRKFAFAATSVCYINGREYTGSGLGQSPYLRQRNIASNSKRKYLKGGDETLVERYIEQYKEAEAFLSKNSSICSAQAQEIDEISRLDLTAIEAVREANFSLLYERMSGIPQMRILPGRYMYFMVMARDRNELREWCFQNGIGPAIHWSDAISKFSEDVLSFHIDQRFDCGDMERLSSVVKGYYRS